MTAQGCAGMEAGNRGVPGVVRRFVTVGTNGLERLLPVVNVIGVARGGGRRLSSLKGRGGGGFASHSSNAALP